MAPPASRATTPIESPEAPTDMFTQEEYMDLRAKRRAGLTIAEIAKELDYDPATISKWLRAGGPSAKRSVDPGLRVITQGWVMRIED